MLSSFSDFSGTNNVHEVAKLYHSTRLRNVLDKIEHFSNLVRKTDDIQGPVEADPEYILVRRPPVLYCIAVVGDHKTNCDVIIFETCWVFWPTIGGIHKWRHTILTQNHSRLCDTKMVVLLAPSNGVPLKCITPPSYLRDIIYEWSLRGASKHWLTPLKCFF